MATVAITGPDSGKMMRHQIKSGEAPSMFTASSRPCAICWRNW